MSLSTIYSKLYSKPQRKDLKSHKVNLALIDEFKKYIDEYHDLYDEIETVLGPAIMQKSNVERAAEVMRFAVSSAEEFKAKIEGLGLTFDSSVLGSYDEQIQEVINNGHEVANKLSQVSKVLGELENTY